MFFVELFAGWVGFLCCVGFGGFGLSVVVFAVVCLLFIRTVD